VIVTGVFTPTAVVVIVNAADTVPPAATVTVAGTTAAALLLVSVTTVPAAGAAPFNVTVFPVVAVPPITAAGVSVTAVGPGGNTVNTAVAAGPLYVAEIVTAVLTPTAVVVIGNAADTVAPAATVTVPGTVVLGSLLVSVTTAPPMGAAPFRLTVPAVDAPPKTGVVISVTPVAINGPTVNVAGTVTPLYVAEIVTGIDIATVLVLMVNACDVTAPPATVTHPGTVVFGSLLVSATWIPPAGAGPFSVTVFAVVAVPPNTDEGVRVTAVGTGGCTVNVPVAVAPP